ncbi:MFS transporter [Sphingopyxis macrogoltabida]|uniref:MFS transporter n=1 Tax=Sphingopyxis macrogoltabida TaxID=33050 RepID=UPI0006ED12F5|nr:MFS transporter [Sphingopyxis macrogoltabida]ALJ11352.1 major facilitator superfamily MFS_1 [Sphingopyxis macrogoltabida]
MKLSAPAYLASYFLSILGNSIAAVALPLIVLDKTGSVLGTGSVAAATALPAIFAGLFMGVVIDRFNRRDCSVVTDLISAFSVAALPIVDHISGLTLSWFILLGIVGSLGDLPGLAARTALLPAVLRHSGASAERMAGFAQVLVSLALLAGPALAGTLMALLPGTTVLWITAATSLLAALATLFIPREVGAVPVEATEQPDGAGWQGLREGWLVLLRSPFLKAMMAIGTLSVMALGALQGLILPVYFSGIDQPSSLGLVLSAIGLGTLAGGAIYGTLGGRGARRRWLVTGLTGATIGFAVIATLASVPVILAGAVVLGLSSALYSGLFGVLSIERVPEHVRGRIAAIQNALITAAVPLGIMGAAVLIELSGLPVAVIATAGIWAAAAATGLFVPALRDLGRAASEAERTPAASFADEPAVTTGMTADA